MQSSVETGTEGGLSGELNVGFAKLGSRLGANDKSLELVSRVLHHDVLARIEFRLANEQVLLDLNDVLGDKNPAEHEVRAAIAGGAPYVRAEGWTMIEDYRRITDIASNFNVLTEFLNRCATDTVKQSPEYQQLRAQIDEMSTQAKAQPNRDERARALQQAKVVEQQLEAMIQAAAGAGQIDDWLVQGIMRFIELFKPGHINLRLYPCESAPGFQLLANLKADCFVDGDVGNFSFAYGIKPNVKLTVLGLVTSIPPKDQPAFDPLQEFAGDDDPDNAQQKGFEKGFRQLFNAFEEIEKLVRFTRYPNVTLFPIAVYRTIR